MMRRTLREAAGTKLSTRERTANILHNRGRKTHTEIRGEERRKKEALEKEERVKNTATEIARSAEDEAIASMKQFMEMSTPLFDDYEDYMDVINAYKEDGSLPDGFEPLFEIDNNKYWFENGFEVEEMTKPCVWFNFGGGDWLRLWCDGELEFPYDGKFLCAEETVSYDKDAGRDSFIDLVKHYLTQPGIDASADGFLAWLNSTLDGCYALMQDVIFPQVDKEVEKKLDELEALEG